jgi:hypothetical protein
MRIIVRGDPFDVTTGSPDVSQFTIGQVREFAPHRLVPPPSLITAGDRSKHGLAVLSPAKRRNRKINIGFSANPSRRPVVDPQHMTEDRRFPPPWTVEQAAKCALAATTAILAPFNLFVSVREDI